MALIGRSTGQRRSQTIFIGFNHWQLKAQQTDELWEERIHCLYGIFFFLWIVHYSPACDVNSTHIVVACNSFATFS